MKKYGYFAVMLLLAMGCAGTPNENEDDYLVPYSFPEEPAVTSQAPAVEPAPAPAASTGSAGTTGTAATAAPRQAAQAPAPAPAPAPAAPRPAASAPMSGSLSGNQMYHVLVVDRMQAALNSDISGGETIVYKFLHGANGYIIVLYISSGGSPTLPEGGRALADFSSAYKSAVSNYINSPVFRKYVTNQKITADLLAALSAHRP